MKFNLIDSIILFVSITLTPVNSVADPPRCRQNFIIKNSAKMTGLEGCQKIDGFIRILLIETENLDNLSFPHLTEITDYLLIYHISNVTTLENWFPNLQFIRGRTLFAGNALVILNLPELRHIGFRKLKHIKGGVRIEDVDKLCFDQTLESRILAEAISHSNNHNESKQLLPGFDVSSKLNNDGRFAVTIKWTYTPVIGNMTMDKIKVRMVEFEDLDFYYKSFERNECQTGPNSTSVAEEEKQTFDEYSFCRSAEYNKPEDKKQKFIISTIEKNINYSEFLSNYIHPIVHISTDDLPANNNSLNSELLKEPIIDSKYYRILRVLDFRPLNIENHTSYVVGRYKHYTSNYFIVYGCQNESCSVIAHQKHRTNPLANADDIDENTINFNVTGNSVRIFWSEPYYPNGYIISYHIHYHQLNNITSKTTICLNRLFYKSIDGIIINDLELYQRYSFKLRAVSMNGPSNHWSKDYEFETFGIIEIKSDPFPIVPFMMGITGLLILFAVTIGLRYYKTPKRNSSIDIISVNPEYEKFIVDPDWEVKKSDVQLFHLLGDGEFGKVYYGELRLNGKLIKCAVKTMNAKPRTQQRDSFLKEANIMKSFVDCYHIVKLIGIVSIENPVLVLMEYMENGDLKTYLRTNRPENDENPNPQVPTWNRIFQMAIEIADGMAYLSNRKFVHRDLAARNCMVAKDLTVKIGDFGMTRDVYDNDYYRKRDCGLIPVRWMSPEALKDGVFTTYCDIWAYGVVLWEMVTLGAQPYQGYSNESVFQSVIRGFKLLEPENCPKKLWRIMQYCWRKNPRTRPSFSEITEFLLPSANQSFREVCYYLNRKPFLTNNPLKKMWYSLIPNNSLLNNDPKEDMNETEQYCQMKPQIQRKSIQLNKEFAENEILKKLNELNNKKMNETNGIINNDCYNNFEIEKVDQKLIEC